MKARPVTAPDKLLIYGFDPESERLFSECAKRMRTELVIIPQGSGAQKIGFLAGISGYEPWGEKLDIPEKCVIFAMDMKKLGKTVEDMNRNGLGGIPLKAALTPINRDMTLEQLVSELKKEHELMHKKEV